MVGASVHYDWGCMVAILLTNLSERIAGYELCEAAHENTTPNYRKDVLQMLDMLT